MVGISYSIYREIPKRRFNQTINDTRYCSKEELSDLKKSRRKKLGKAIKRVCIDADDTNSGDEEAKVSVSVPHSVIYRGKGYFIDNLHDNQLAGDRYSGPDGVPEIIVDFEENEDPPFVGPTIPPYRELDDTQKRERRNAVRRERKRLANEAWTKDDIDTTYLGKTSAGQIEVTKYVRPKADSLQNGKSIVIYRLSLKDTVLTYICESVRQCARWWSYGRVFRSKAGDGVPGIDSVWGIERDSQDLRKERELPCLDLTELKYWGDKGLRYNSILTLPPTGKGSVPTKISKTRETADVDVMGEEDNDVDVVPKVKPGTSTDSIKSSGKKGIKRYSDVSLDELRAKVLMKRRKLEDAEENEKLEKQRREQMEEELARERKIMKVFDIRSQKVEQDKETEGEEPNIGQVAEGEVSRVDEETEVSREIQETEQGERNIGGEVSRVDKETEGEEPNIGQVAEGEVSRVDEETEVSTEIQETEQGEQNVGGEVSRVDGEEPMIGQVAEGEVSRVDEDTQEDTEVSREIQETEQVERNVGGEVSRVDNIGQVAEGEVSRVDEETEVSREIQETEGERNVGGEVSRVDKETEGEEPNIGQVAEGEVSRVDEETEVSTEIQETEGERNVGGEVSRVDKETEGEEPNIGQVAEGEVSRVDEETEVSTEIQETEGERNVGGEVSRVDKETEGEEPNIGQVAEGEVSRVVSL